MQEQKATVHILHHAQYRTWTSTNRLHCWIALLHVWAQERITLLERPYVAPCTVSHLDFRKPAKVLDNPAACHLAHKSSIGTSTHSSPGEGHTLHHAPYLTRTSANQLHSPCSTSLGIRNQYRHKPVGASQDEHCQHYHPWVTRQRQ